MKSHYRLTIKKPALKFASAHMTVFADGTKEALHGHNYQVGLVVEMLDASLQQMISFSVFKDAMKQICAEWDEKVILAEKCPQMKLKSQTPGRTFSEVDFTLCGKHYVLPADEVVFLAVDNITSESLAAEFAKKLVIRLHSSPEAEKLKGLLSFGLEVEESPGQGATYVMERPFA